MNDSYRQRDLQSVWHPYSNTADIESEPFPIITHGDGIYLYDSDGNRYIDGISSWWACNLGHGHPRIVEAIQKQAGTLQHSMIGGMSHPPVIELAERLTSILPPTLAKVFFASDGSSAVEAALKIAVQYWHNIGKPKKTGFASIAGAYHGDTLGAVSVGMVERFHEPFRPLLFKTFKAEAPYCYRCPRGKTRATCDIECFGSMEAIVRERHEELAAVVVEPLNLAASGMRIYPAEYLTRLGRLCKQYDVLLIDDEIAMGYGRSGKMFAFEHAAIAPDIVCLGKSMSAGYLPISATVVTEEIFSSFRSSPGHDCTFYHGHTFTGNPICAAAAAETLRVFEEERVLEEMQPTVRALTEEMAKLAELPYVGDVRQIGMVGAIELVADKQMKTPFAPELRVVPRICAEVRKRGVLLRPLGDVVYLWPPLNIRVEELQGLVGMLAEAMDGVVGRF